MRFLHKIKLFFYKLLKNYKYIIRIINAITIKKYTCYFKFYLIIFIYIFFKNFDINIKFLRIVLIICCNSYE